MCYSTQLQYFTDIEMEYLHANVILFPKGTKILTYF